MSREPVKIIADILSHEMNLPPERIFIYNDGRVLPNDDGLYIVLYVNSRPPYGARTYYKGEPSNLIEVQTLNVKETIIASAVSKNTDARTRSYEVQMAINSTFAQQKQEEFGCHISMIAPVRDMSFLEETARLNRFDTEITILTVYEKETPVDYFDSVDTESSFQP
jgi:hypothetical protein